MPEIKKINHIALVVEDMEAALGFWRDALGLELEKVSQVPREESAVGFLPVGASEIELVQPTSTDSGVAKFLAKRGPGMHHLCLEVKDIEMAVNQLLDKGVRMIHQEPVVSEDGRKYAFIHPKAAFGVLVELYELPGETPGKFPEMETQRLVLREFNEQDIGAVFDMYAREDMNAFVEHEPMQSIEEAQQRVKGRISLFKNGWGYRWAIAFKDSPEKLIGSCGYFHVRVNTHTVECGFEVHPDFWRQKIMTEAMTAILNFSFSGRGFRPVNRFEALVDPKNEASLGLLKGLGFLEEGTRRKFGYWKGSYNDVKLMALIEEDWQF